MATKAKTVGRYTQNKIHPIVASKAGGNIVSHKTLFSLNANFLVTISEKKILVFSTSTGERVKTLQGHKNNITSIFLNPFNPLQLYSTSLDGTVRLWDYEEGTELYKIIVKDCPPEIVFATPSLTEYGVLYVIGRVPYYHNYKMYKIYMGVTPPAQAKINDTKLTEEQAKCAVFGTGIIGPDGKEILRPGFEKLQEDKVKSLIDNFYERLEYFPTQVQRIKDVKTFYEEHLIKHIAHKPIGMTSNKHSLFVMYSTSVDIFTINPDIQYSHTFSTEYSLYEMNLHPTEDLIALAFNNGSIGFLRPFSEDTGKITETYHWHNIGCSVQFSDDGLYLISGSHECVMVVWQLSTGKKQFFPGLGSKIVSVSASADSKYYGISTAHNCIHIFHTASSKISHTISSIVYDARSIANVVIEPKNGFIVSEGVPGILQFYNPITDRHGAPLTVARNAINVSDAQTSFIHYIKFSANGDWLVTVDVREIVSSSICTGQSGSSKLTATQTRATATLKFWKYNNISKVYDLNSQVNSPHETITSIAFHPIENIVVSTGDEGKFIFWTVGKREKVQHQTKQNGATDKEGDNQSYFWYCKATGFYQHSRVHASCFSEDGSLLALSYSHTITLWDPETITLKHTLTHTISDFPITEIQFLTKTPYLLSANKSHFFVWNLLSLSIWWYSELYSIKSIAVDPIYPRFSVCMAQQHESPNISHLFSPAQLDQFQIEEYVPELKDKSPPNPVKFSPYSKDIIEQITFSDKYTKLDKKKPPQSVEEVVQALVNNKIESQLSMSIPPIGYRSDSIPDERNVAYIVCFNADSQLPISVTPLQCHPRSNIIYLNSEFNKCPVEPFPLVGYLADYSFFFQGPKSFMKQTLKSLNSKIEAKQTPAVSTFAEIFGDLKQIQDQFKNEIQPSFTPTASTLDNNLLNAPTHLIPSIPLLYSSFIDSLLAKPPPTTSDNGIQSGDATKKEYESNNSESVAMELDDEVPKMNGYFDEQTLLTSEIIPDFDILKHPEYKKLSKQFSLLNV